LHEFNFFNYSFWTDLCARQNKIRKTFPLIFYYLKKHKRICKQQRWNSWGKLLVLHFGTTKGMKKCEKNLKAEPIFKFV
jgi:hypothetical protein